MGESMIETMLLSLIGFLVTCLLGLIVYFFKQMANSVKVIASEIIELNKKLVVLTSNQEWHYKSIVKLQSDVEELQGKKQQGRPAHFGPREDENL